MADTPVAGFDWKKWISGFINPVTWGKAVVFLVIGGVIFFIVVCVKDFFFPPEDRQTISSDVIVKPFGKIEEGGVDIENNQILVEEKKWEAGVGVGGVTYDNKNGAILGGWVKRKW